MSLPLKKLLENLDPKLTEDEITKLLESGFGAALSGIVQLKDSDFSITQKFNDYMGNSFFKQGFEKVKTGQFDFDNSEEMEVLWSFLSGSNEEVGQKFFPKIRCLVQFVRDIDLCTVDALESMGEELGLRDTQFFNFNFPLEIRELMDIFSIKSSRVLLSGQTLTDQSLDDIFTLFNIDPLTGDTPIEAISGENVFIKETIEDEDYITFVECVLSATIINFLTLDGIIDELSGNFDPPPDTDDIENLKIDLLISRSFNVRNNVDKIQRGELRLNDFSQTEQIVLSQELLNRREEQVQGDFTSKFKFEKEKKVREYIAFTENLNLEQNSTILDECNTVISGDALTFSAENSAKLVDNAVHYLRNIAFRASYQRDNLKTIASKFILIGTNTILKTLISEYLAREFTDQDDWRYFTFSGIENSSVDISDLPITQELSTTILGDIDVIEYFDTTEYMNISAITDLPKEDPSEVLVNPRFFEGEELRDAILDSEHSVEEVSTFFVNLGITDKDELELSAFLSAVYDLGAISATTSATFENIPTPLEVSGTFGDFGSFEQQLDQSFTITGDIAPIFSFIENSETSVWLEQAMLVSNEIDTSAKLVTLWEQIPVVSSWQNTFNILGLDFSLSEEISAFIDNNFTVTGWIENLITPVWQASDLIARWTTTEFKDEWEKTFNELELSTDQIDFYISSFWRNVSTLVSGDFSWINLPEVQDFLELCGFAEDGSNLPQSAWDESEFIEPWVDDPFTSAIIENTFDPDEDWGLSAVPQTPFVLELSAAPFDLILTNTQIISSGFSKIAAQTILADLGAIDPADGGLFRFTDVVEPSASLSAMFFKYLGIDDGEFPPANFKNQIHPSIAHQPLLYNLIESIPELSNQLTEVIIRIILRSLEDQIALLVTRINEFGSTIDSWRKENIEFTAYETFYEDSRNLNFLENVDEDIDRDGPWHPDALSSYLLDTSGFITDLRNKVNGFYDHVVLGDLEREKIANQLEIYENQIRELSGKTIFQYGTDLFQNHYTLYKDANEFDLTGDIWMRFRNHPISFPLISGGFDTSQIDNDIVSLEQVVNACNDFALFRNHLVAIGATPGKEPFSAISGFVPTIELVNVRDNIENRFKLTSRRDPVLAFEGFDLRETDKFIGFYEHFGNIVLSRLFKEPDIPLSAESYLTPLDNEFRVNVRFDVYDPFRNIIEQQTRRVNVPYDEFTFPLSSPEYHNQWKLAKGDEIITTAFEMEGPSGDFEPGFDPGSAVFFDVDFNDCSAKFFDNGITTIDFRITTNRAFGHEPIDIQHFFKYTELTFLGINANDGILRSDFDFDLIEGEQLNLQFFGTPGTSAEFTVSGDGPFTIFNSSAGNLNVCLSGLNPAQWFALDFPWDDANFTWEEVFSLQCIEFINVGEIAQFFVTLQTQNPKIYTFTYLGSACHLFSIEVSALPRYIWEDEDFRLFEDGDFEITEQLGPFFGK